MRHQFKALSRTAHLLSCADVTRHLKLNADYYSNMPIEQALNEAFRHVNGDASIARWCFHNCMYRAP